METEEGNVREENVYCVQCHKTGLFTLDAVFMMNCDYCLMDKKEACKQEWFKKMSNDLLPCEVCLASYTEENRLMFHSCKREGIEGCQRCGQQFYSWKSMKKHCKIVHNFVIDEHDCVECSVDNYEFDNQSYRYNFVQDSSSYILCDKPHQCYICSKSFGRKYDLLRHIRSHTAEKSYKCPSCNKSFIRKYELDRHSRSHMANKPYQCPTCNKCFKQKCDLLRHSHLHTAMKSKCTSCKSFIHKSILLDHDYSRTDEKPYQCLSCRKSFTDKYNIGVDNRCHTGEKPFRCATCSNSFTRKYHLLAHVRCHTRDKPYQCHICSKSFTKKSNFIIHTCSPRNE